MEITITNKLEKKTSTNNKSTIAVYESSIVGGSTTEYDSTFSVKEVQTFEFILAPGNTFNEQILALVNADYNEISLVEAFCYQEGAQSDTMVPVNFRVTVNDGTNSIIMGLMSKLSLQDLKNSNIQQITIDQITVAASKTAALIVVIATKNTNA